MNTAIQLPKERVALLDPSDIEGYLLTHGWEEDPSGSPAQVGRFRYGPDPRVTALVPRDRGFLDYAVRLGDVLHTLAVLERRPIWEVLETLLARRTSPASNGPTDPRPKTTRRSRASGTEEDAS
jgi:hypothetical protein